MSINSYIIHAIGITAVLGIGAGAIAVARHTSPPPPVDPSIARRAAVLTALTTREGRVPTVVYRGVSGAMCGLTSPDADASGPRRFVISAPALFAVQDVSDEFDNLWSAFCQPPRPAASVTLPPPDPAQDYELTERAIAIQGN